MNTPTTNYNISFDGKVSIKRASLFNNTKLCKFQVQHPKLNNIDIITEKGQQNHIYISIKKNKEILANEDISLYKKEKEVYGWSIATKVPYRKQKLGELLRLTSVITMLENKANNIKIHSLHDAIFFHRKYKFKPDIRDLSDANRILRNLTCVKSPEYSKKAIILSKR